MKQTEISFIYTPVKKGTLHVDRLIFIKCENPTKARLDRTDHWSQTLFCMLPDFFLPEIGEQQIFIKGLMRAVAVKHMIRNCQLITCAFDLSKSAQAACSEQLRGFK